MEHLYLTPLPIPAAGGSTRCSRLSSVVRVESGGAILLRDQWYVAISLLLIHLYPVKPSLLISPCLPSQVAVRHEGVVSWDRSYGGFEVFLRAGTQALMILIRRNLHARDSLCVWVVVSLTKVMCHWNHLPTVAQHKCPLIVTRSTKKRNEAFVFVTKNTK